MSPAPGRRPAPEDERRHLDVDERWWFDFAATDGSMGGYAALFYLYGPAARVAWYWAAFVADGRPLLTFRAHDVAIPTRGTEVRGDGIWACLTCETPLEHWSVGLESFGVELEDPLEAWGGERGDVVPFGLDLEWEATALGVAGEGGYGQWCEVHGEVLVGDERIAVACGGHREHLWGATAGVGGAGVGGAGVGGAAWRVAVPGVGWVTSPPAPPTDLVTVRDEGGLPVGAALGGVDLRVRHVSPVAVPGAAVVHALCTPAGSGAGWVSWW